MRFLIHTKGPSTILAHYPNVVRSIGLHGHTSIEYWDLAIDDWRFIELTDELRFPLKSYTLILRSPKVRSCFQFSKALYAAESGAEPDEDGQVVVLQGYVFSNDANYWESMEEVTESADPALTDSDAESDAEESFRIIAKDYV